MKGRGFEFPDLKRGFSLKNLFSGSLYAVFLFFVLATLLPDAQPSASAVEAASPSKTLEVDPDLILGPAERESAGPLVRRARSLAETDEVKGQLDHLLTEKREVIRKSLGLSTKYLPHIMPILERHDLPSELAFLCLIESGYHHSARSHAGAVGMWQMIRATSKRFGLVTDSWVDERLDFVRSTEGAARFFSYLKGRFDNWDQVLAAYNAGEGRVRTAVKKARVQNQEPDFQNLRLPRETRIYVPAFYAALLIAMEPERYGLFPEYQPPLDFKEVRIPGGVPLATVSLKLGCDLSEIRVLNPSIRKDRVPFSEGGFPLKVPSFIGMERAERVAQSLREVTYVSYRVRQGDTLWDISRKFGVSISRISRSSRGKGHPSRIFPGEILVVSLVGEG